MLPPGHVAGGYLTAYALIKLTHPALDQQHIDSLLLTGAFLGFAPDLDSFYAFYKVKSFTIQNNQVNHRGFLSHTPFVWLIAGLLIYFLSSNEFIKYIGLLVWLGPWSHFALDSFSHGVKWLWPLNDKFYALQDPGKSKGLEQKGFTQYWFKFLFNYTHKRKSTFIAEVLIILTALIIFFK